MPTGLPQTLQAFAQWASQHCTGSERANAQPFLNEFFKAFGYDGALEAGARFEDPLKKGSVKGNTGFMDCLYADVALIEMKKRGTPLGNFYNQLLSYWVQCTPKPKYAILCNFDEFWIYDFNIQVDTPVQVLQTNTMHQHPEALAFMQGQKPNFGLNAIQVTEKAAQDVSHIYNSLMARHATAGFTQADAQRFILQCVLCMFAEDIGLMPAGFFTALMDDCRQAPTQSYDLLRALFTQMNTKAPATGGRFKPIRYFNGGLFAHIAPIELTADECERMYQAAVEDWRGVRPSIFGTIFEATLTAPERHAGGVHFTSDLDIYKIVNPTIVRYWEDRIQTADNNPKRLRGILDDLRTYRVLDPACGSGNFLYIAYLELKRLEKLVMDTIKDVVETDTSNRDDYKPKYAEGTHISLVSPLQFYGIELKPFGAELAKLTLEIGRKIAVDKFGLSEDPLPLDNLDANIHCADALFTPWPQADAIIGNPPFLGGKLLKKELGTDYIEKVYAQFPMVKGQVDFCVHWFRLAHNSKAQRIGLVATNSIAQGVSRSASLDYVIQNGGIIHDAVTSQVWSGEANVYVSIVNWSKQNEKVILLNQEAQKKIASNLKTEYEVATAFRLDTNQGKCFEACQLNGKGFIISEKLAMQWINKNPDYKTILKPIVDGRSLINPFIEKEWVIDFYGLSVELASQYTEAFELVKKLVKPARDQNNEKGRRERWWLFGRSGEKMRTALSGLTCYFALPKIAKYTNFTSISNDVFPCEANMVVASDDFYILGVLNSVLHRDWVKAQCSTLKGDTRYTNTTCFETFPFLWDAPAKLTDPVRAIMHTLNTYRMDTMAQRNWGITQLYNAFFTEPTSQLAQYHRQLDAAVCAVYGWKFDPTKNYNQQLFDLNQQLHHTATMPLLPLPPKPKPRVRKPLMPKG
jgi:hypothetical protein